MIIKHGTKLLITKVATSLQEVLHGEKLAKLLDQKQENEIYFITRALTCDVPNANGDVFPKEEVKKAYNTFVGKGLFLNHDADAVEKAVGKVIGADFIDDKQDDIHVICICKVNKDLEPKIAQKILYGIITSVSMGCSATTCECGICGKVCESDTDYCDHLKHLGHEITTDKGERKIVTSINRGLSYNELSLVANPADESANLIQVWAKAQDKNVIKKVASDMGMEIPKEADKRLEDLMAKEIARAMNEGHFLNEGSDEETIAKVLGIGDLSELDGEYCYNEVVKMLTPEAKEKYKEYIEQYFVKVSQKKKESKVQIGKTYWITEGSGVDSGKKVTVVSKEEFQQNVKTNERGIPEIPGAYTTVDWLTQVPVKFDDGHYDVMFANRLVDDEKKASVSGDADKIKEIKDKGKLVDTETMDYGSGGVNNVHVEEYYEYEGKLYCIVDGKQLESVEDIKAHKGSRKKIRSNDVSKTSSIHYKGFDITNVDANVQGKEVTVSQEGSTEYIYTGQNVDDAKSWIDEFVKNHKMDVASDKKTPTMYRGYSIEWNDKEGEYEIKSGVDSKYGFDGGGYKTVSEAKADIDAEEASGKESSSNASVCPECNGKMVSGCKCASKVYHRPRDIKKGHGSRCANGHAWSNGYCINDKTGELVKEYGEHKTAGTWEVPTKVDQAQQLDAFLKTLVDDKKVDEERIDSIEEQIALLIGDDQLFDDIEEAKTEGQIKWLIIGKLQEWIEDYNKQPSSFNVRFDPKALEILYGITTNITEKEGVSKNSGEWKQYGFVKNYTIWEGKTEQGQTVYNITKDENPPHNVSGYIKLESLLELKNLDMKDVTLVHDKESKKEPKPADEEQTVHSFDVIVTPEKGETVDQICSALEGLREELNIEDIEKNVDNVVVTVKSLTEIGAKDAVEKALTQSDMPVHIITSETRVIKKADALVKDITGEPIVRGDSVTIKDNKGEFKVTDCFIEDDRELVEVDYNGKKKVFPSNITKRVMTEQELKDQNKEDNKKQSDTTNQEELDAIQSWLADTTELFDDWDWDGQTLKVFRSGKKVETYTKQDLIDANVFQNVKQSADSRQKYRDAVKKKYEEAKKNINSGDYETAYNNIISALDNFDTQFGKDFHLEFKHNGDGLGGDYKLEVNGDLITPSTLEEDKDMVLSAIDGALTEIQEDKSNKKTSADATIRVGDTVIENGVSEDKYLVMEVNKESGEASLELESSPYTEKKVHIDKLVKVASKKTSDVGISNVDIGQLITEPMQHGYGTAGKPGDVNVGTILNIKGGWALVKWEGKDEPDLISLSEIDKPEMGGSFYKTIKEDNKKVADGYSELSFADVVKSNLAIDNNLQKAVEDALSLWTGGGFDAFTGTQREKAIQQGLDAYNSSVKESSDKQAADPIPPKPDDSTLSPGNKWVFNRDTNAWEQKPQSEQTVDVTADATGSKYQVVRRTFEALKHPKDSEERKKLNEDTITSEYMPSYKYAVVEEGSPHGPHTFRTKSEAEAFVDSQSKEGATATNTNSGAGWKEYVTFDGYTIWKSSKDGKMYFVITEENGIPSDEGSKEGYAGLESLLKEKGLWEAYNKRSASSDIKEVEELGGTITKKEARLVARLKAIKSMRKYALNKWQPAENYMGEDYSDYYVVATQNRDSEAIAQSNFSSALEMLGGEKQPDVIVVRFNHWMVGWVEMLLVKETATDKVEIAKDIEQKIKEYPVLNDDDFMAKQDTAYNKWLDDNMQSYVEDNYDWLGVEWDKLDENDKNYLRSLMFDHMEGPTDDITLFDEGDIRKDWSHYMSEKKLGPTPDLPGIVDDKDKESSKSVVADASEVKVYKNKFDFDVVFPNGEVYEMNAQSNMPNGVCIYLGQSDHVEFDKNQPVSMSEVPDGMKEQINNILKWQKESNRVLYSAILIEGKRWIVNQGKRIVARYELSSLPAEANDKKYARHIMVKFAGERFNAKTFKVDWDPKYNKISITDVLSNTDNVIFKKDESTPISDEEWDRFEQTVQEWQKNGWTHLKKNSDGSEVYPVMQQGQGEKEAAIDDKQSGSYRASGEDIGQLCAFCQKPIKEGDMIWMDEAFNDDKIPIASVPLYHWDCHTAKTANKKQIVASYPNTYFKDSNNKDLLERASIYGLMDVENHDLTVEGLLAKMKEWNDAFGGVEAYVYDTTKKDLENMGSGMPIEIRRGEPGIDEPYANMGDKKADNSQSIYEQMKALNIPMDHHASDLYVKVTPESQKIVDAYKFKKQVTTFIDNIDHKQWFDIPFAYDPFWMDKVKSDKTVHQRKTAETMGEDRMKILRRIVENSQYEDIDGMRMDGFTASMLVQIYDALGDKQKQQFSNLPLSKMVDIGWNLMKKVSSKKETDPSLKPPKKWWNKMVKEVKDGNPSYDAETVDKTVGKIWSDLSDAKKSELRENEGKHFGPAPDKKKAEDIVSVDMVYAEKLALAMKGKGMDESTIRQVLTTSGLNDDQVGNIMKMVSDTNKDKKASGEDVEDNYTVVPYKGDNYKGGYALYTPKQHPEYLEQNGHVHGWYKNKSDAQSRADELNNAVKKNKEKTSEIVVDADGANKKLKTVEDLRNEVKKDNPTFPDYITIDGIEYMMVEYDGTYTHKDGHQSSRYITYVDIPTANKEIYIDKEEKSVEEQSPVIDWAEAFPGQVGIGDKKASKQDVHKITANMKKKLAGQKENEEKILKLEEQRANAENQLDEISAEIVRLSAEIDNLKAENKHYKDKNADITSALEALQFKVALDKKVVECRILAEEAFEKGIIHVDDEWISSQVNSGKDPFETEANAIELAIAKQAKLLRSYPDDKITGYREMLSAFQKVASTGFKKSHNTLKTFILSDGEALADDENIVVQALRERKRNHA